MTPLAPGAGADIPMSESRMSMASRSNRDSMAYQNIPSEQYWAEPSRFSTGPLVPDYDEVVEPPKKSNKKKWIIGGVILGILAIAGIVAGVVVSQTKGKSSGSNGSGSSSSGNGTSTDLSNPSVFDKDSRLHQSFWAMAYTPEVCWPCL
jgi:glucan 1,3-beta-glucosidase